MFALRCGAHSEYCRRSSTRSDDPQLGKKLGQRRRLVGFATLVSESRSRAGITQQLFKAPVCSARTRERKLKSGSNLAAGSLGADAW